MPISLPAHLDANTKTPPHLLQTFRCHDFKMDEDIIEQVEPHIREILRICSALSVEGRELYELSMLVGLTSKLRFIHLYQYAEDAGAVQNHVVELNGGADC
jgi:hypothetical protein